MKIIKFQTMDTEYLMRHWGRWYAVLRDGGLIYVGPWFKKAREDKKNG